MRRIIRLILLLSVVAAIAWIWKTNPDSLISFKDRILAKVSLVYEKISNNDSETPEPTAPAEKKIIWCSEKCFWFGRDGKLFEEAPKTEGSLIKTVKTSASAEIKTGDQVLEPEEAENLYRISEIMKKFDFSFGVIDLGDLSLKEAAIEIDSGVKFYFSLKNSPEYSVAVIESLIKSGEIKNLQYVDFRMENRAYYK
ncbi:MAG TPA: hypothetical protein PLN18_01240 [Candidatus Colwellbacteria bacterium]|nr:hypothetical protein [Candidatus Colwellbacteria bacterium]HQA95978.1 hypothetical protein [Candidatus Colwellbacteria bacterium]